jgi:hypothetical protein
MSLRNDISSTNIKRTEEKNVTEHKQLTNTVFGEVLASQLEARGLEVTPFKVGLLAEEAGLDGWKVINRMAAADNPSPGDLRALVERLGLTEPERDTLALAYAFEQRAPTTTA